MNQKRQTTIHWVVDAQNDFMSSNGSLYVQGAEDIKKNIARNVKMFHDKFVTQVFTMDWHYDKSEELSESPDFINTFPNHCMANTTGAELISEIQTLIGEHFDECSWTDYYNYQDMVQICKEKYIIIKKDKFDVFTGNQYTDKIVTLLNPDIVYISGVATNVCVDRAVMGFLERGVKVRVIVDSIKELPNIPINPVIDAWVSKGAKLV